MAHAPDSRKGDCHDSHAQQLHAGPNQHTEEHRVLRRRPENVSVDQLLRRKEVENSDGHKKMAMSGVETGATELPSVGNGVEPPCGYFRGHTNVRPSTTNTNSTTITCISQKHTFKGQPDVFRNIKEYGL